MNSVGSLVSPKTIGLSVKIFIYFRRNKRIKVTYTNFGKIQLKLDHGKYGKFERNTKREHQYIRKSDYNSTQSRVPLMQKQEIIAISISKEFEQYPKTNSKFWDCKLIPTYWVIKKCMCFTNHNIV